MNNTTKKSLKIAHILQFLGVGGLEKVLLLLIQEQLKAGHDITVYVYDYNKEWVEYYRSFGINVVTNIKKEKGFDHRLPLKFRRELSTFDIIHSHDLNPMIYMAILKILYRVSFLKKPKFIHTTHGMEHVKYTPKTNLYEKFFSKLMDQIITVSKSFREYYLELGLSKSKVHNIDNGILIPDEIDKKASSNARENLIKKYNISSDNYICISIARIVPLKQQKLLINLAKRNSKITLLLIGPSGHNEYYKELEKIKPDNVILTGGKNDVLPFIQGADIYLSASLHEGLPISVLEAAVYKLPCVLSDIPGHRVLEAGLNKDIAYFFDPKDLNSLSDTFDLMLNNKIKTKEFIKNLYSNINNFYSSKTMSDKVEYIYYKTI